MNTTAPPAARLTGLVAVLTAGAVALAGPASASLGVWTMVPPAFGAVASAKMDYLNYTSGSGVAGGQVYLQNPTNKLLYIQIKPADGGLWKRATPNVLRAKRMFAWKDKTFLRQSGYTFRICKDSAAQDECARAVVIRKPAPRSAPVKPTSPATPAPRPTIPPAGATLPVVNGGTTGTVAPYVPPTLAPQGTAALPTVG